MGAGYHGGFGNTKGSAHNNESAKTPKKESRADLISELRKNDIKFSEKDIVFIVRDTTGKIVWLENGNSLRGLKHILDGANGGQGHAKDFKNAFGISREKIPSFLKSVFSKGTIIKESVITRNGRKGYERIYRYNGKYLILSGIGTNGFIVSAYPTTKEKL